MKGDKCVCSSTHNLEVKGHTGTWYVVDQVEYNEEVYYLCESEQYGEDAAWICIREDGSLLCSDIYNGSSDVLEYLEEHGGE
jgi:hypothetical protein